MNVQYTLQHQLPTQPLSRQLITFVSRTGLNWERLRDNYYLCYMDPTPYTDFISHTCRRLAYPNHADIIQDVNLKLLSVNPAPSNIKGYIYCTCRSAYIDRLRKEKNITPQRTNPTTTPLIDRDLRNKVRALPRHLRRLIWMVAMGCTYVEMAKYTRKPLGTVKSELHIARKIIKHSL